MTNILLSEPVLFESLRCPKCKQGHLEIDLERLACTCCPARYPFSDGRPILLRDDNQLFAVENYVNASVQKNSGSGRLERIVPSPSVNLSNARILTRLRSELNAVGIANILVVGGGRQRVWLDPLLRAGGNHNIVYSDIDSGADIDVFCDGHDLPFADGRFDAVITTAVLEHVMYPERVAGEITRVLKLGGLLYSELPFMQQVHEGAYDFTRYTLSGHRRLFNEFLEIETGMVAGPATVMVWTIENLALAFVRGVRSRKVTKAGVRILFGWIRYLDYLLANRPEAMDGASGTYFYGSRSDTVVSDIEIVRRYVGAKPLQHV